MSANYKSTKGQLKAGPPIRVGVFINCQGSPSPTTNLVLGSSASAGLCRLIPLHQVPPGPEWQHDLVKGPE